MKIAKVIAHPLAADYDQPSWTAHEYFDRAQLVLVEIRTDQGVTGVGEIAGGPQKLICDLLKTFSDVIKGMDPLDHDRVWRTLFSLTSPRPGGLGGWDGLPAPLPRNHRPQIMAAIGGIDIALWDIKGKVAGQPVFRLLGGTRTKVFTYAVGGFYVEGAPMTACADELAEYVTRGYRAVKLKTGALSLANEVARIRAVRAAIGPDVLFMLDMNAPYNVAGCIEFAKAVTPYDIFWLEEPLHWYLQPVDFTQLAAATSIPLAHGEREWHGTTVRDFIDSGAIRYVQFDATRHAGFTEALRIADHAKRKGVSIAPHTAAHIHGHLVSAFGDAAFGAESVGLPERHPIHHAIYQGGAEMKADGMLHLTEAPGFGFDVDWKWVGKLRA
ncbi:MAG: mandelate racemase/muconate lactonizing enzyme family protein [Alphaproteobacteria bacterium]|nr:mandelate racemase/muconate lactonizing enzyme family protein [Alphaproteobacteria bacterium]